MKITIVVLCCVSIIFSCKEKQNPNTLLSPGVSIDLANYRKTQVDNVVYKLLFNIPKKQEDSIPSTLKLMLDINNLEHPLYLDFNVNTSHIKQITANQNSIPIKHEQEHIIIDVPFLKLGKNTIDINFIAGEQSLNRNSDYLYTLLVPDRARTLFPCLDQPNIKARYTLEITTPKDWKVLSTASLALKEENNETVTHKFNTSNVISSYLFSFVAGVFKETNTTLDGLKMNMLYRETDSAKIATSNPEIFKLHSQSVAFLKDYTQYDFPFEKLDLAVIPAFQYGGMEHVGAVQYRESRLYLDQNATQKQILRRCKLIAHETAHMWYGDLVTMDWFDDVWLKEVFANFLADKIAEPIFPEINHRLNFMSEHYPSAYSEDRTQGAVPIKQQLNNLKDAGTIYGRIVYNKSPIMMRQLEALVGEKSFKTGMRNYIKKYAFANADWNDLVTLLDAETNYDLKTWSNAWVYKSGRPVITDSIIYKNGKIAHFKIAQHAENGSKNIWPQQFNIGLVYNDSIMEVPVNITGKTLKLTQLEGLEQPKHIIYNYNAFGYGIFPLSELDAQFIPKITNNVARGYSYINLYENVLIGNINPKLAFKVLHEGIILEKNEIILNNMISSISTLFWHFISEEDRNHFTKTLESSVKQILLNDSVLPSMKKTYFGLYKRIVYSKEGTAFLYQIWNKSVVIQNLNLNETDYTNLACTLALYNHPDYKQILQTALKNISNNDRKERLRFLLPALSNTVEERDKFVQSLSEAKNREKESWVGTAMSYINHPLRQEISQKHLKFYLDLVEEIQRTGDIFFPKSWLNATIGHYSSEYAHQVVETFLKEHPDYPLTLKNKLLQASDKVYQAKQLRDQ
ncbi:MAG: M1 family metallopeptidase [Aestuariibaculum sp.]